MKKYNRPLDMSYCVSDPVWDIYINGEKINKNENQILESFHKEIENKHKMTIDIKSNIYNLIENIIKYDDPAKRNSEYLISNDNLFVGSLIKILRLFSMDGNTDSFYEYMMLAQIYNSSSESLNSDFNIILLSIINNEFSKILTDQMDVITKNVLKSINSNLLIDLQNFDFSSPNINLVKKIININKYLYSSDFIDYLYEYIYNFSFVKSTNLVNSIAEIVKNEWKKIENIYYDVISSLEKVTKKFYELNDDTLLLKKYLQSNIIILISQNIIKLYDSNEKNRIYLSQLLDSYGLNTNSIIPLLRIISSDGPNFLISRMDIMRIIVKYIQYKYFDWNWLLFDDNKIWNINRGNKGEQYIEWRPFQPYAHVFKHYKIEIWQALKIFRFFLMNITDKDNKLYTMSELINLLKWTYSYVAGYNIDEFEQTLSISNSNLQLRAILDIDENKYMLNFDDLFNIFYNDHRKGDDSIFSVNVWLGWRNIKINSYSTKLDFINSKQDYSYSNLLGSNTNEFSYKIKDDNSIEWNTEINLNTPTIASNLVDLTTNNIFKTIDVSPRNQAHRPYFINIMKEFIFGFYSLFDKIN